MPPPGLDCHLKGISRAGANTVTTADNEERDRVSHLEKRPTNRKLSMAVAVAKSLKVKGGYMMWPMR